MLTKSSTLLFVLVTAFLCRFAAGDCGDDIATAANSNDLDSLLKNPEYVPLALRELDRTVCNKNMLWIWDIFPLVEAKDITAHTIKTTDAGSKLEGILAAVNGGASVGRIQINLFSEHYFVVQRNAKAEFRIYQSWERSITVAQWMEKGKFAYGGAWIKSDGFIKDLNTVMSGISEDTEKKTKTIPNEVPAAFERIFGTPWVRVWDPAGQPRAFFAERNAGVVKLSVEVKPVAVDQCSKNVGALLGFLKRTQLPSIDCGYCMAIVQSWFKREKAKTMCGTLNTAPLKTDACIAVKLKMKPIISEALGIKKDEKIKVTENIGKYKEKVDSKGFLGMCQVLGQCSKDLDSKLFEWKILPVAYDQSAYERSLIETSVTTENENEILIETKSSKKIKGGSQLKILASKRNMK